MYHKCLAIFKNIQMIEYISCLLNHTLYVGLEIHMNYGGDIA